MQIQSILIFQIGASVRGLYFIVSLSKLSKYSI